MSTPIARWPAPGDCPCVALMGGTFDPVHVGHVALGLAARDAINAQWLVYMPAARNPLKPDPPLLTDRERVELLALATEGLDRVGVSTLEIDESDGVSPSYTVDTLRTLALTLPATKFRLVIGADSARSFHLWRSPREIEHLAEPVVVLRHPDESPDSLLRSLEPHWGAAELERWRGRIAPAPLVNASASSIRDLIARAEWDDPELRRTLHPAVLDRLRARPITP